MKRSEKFIFGLAILVFCLVVITISIVYCVLRGQGTITSNSTSTSDLSGYIYNPCTSHLQNPTLLFSLINEEIFDYRQFQYSLSPSVISTKMTLLFGFQHQSDFWGLDNINIIDTFTNNIIPINFDGNFELNNLTKFYSQCILTNNLNNHISLSQIGWDFPYLGNCYYMDGTIDGLTYLIQSFPIVGGRTYQITFWLQNNGNPPNLALILTDS